MFQEMLTLTRFYVIVIRVYAVPQNNFLMQTKIFIIFPTKIKNNHTENKKYIYKKILNFGRYVDHIIIFLPLCQKPPGRNLKKENKVVIFTFFEVF